jgi:hypothetical protein
MLTQWLSSTAAESQLTLTGDSVSLRLCFALLRGFACYGDVTSVGEQRLEDSRTTEYSHGAQTPNVNEPLPRVGWLWICLLAMMTPFTNAQVPKLGSDGDPIRQGLFACQTMRQLLTNVKFDGNSSPFETIAQAATLAENGEKAEARSRLHTLLAAGGLETRIQLLAWSALRELGELPEAKLGTEVLGVVIEVPMRDGYDTLAAYQDSTARYLNFSGSAIFWDARDDTIAALCRRFIAAGASAGAQAKPRNDVSLPRSGSQITLLTRSGPYVIASVSPTVMGDASALVMELTHRSKQARQ